MGMAPATTPATAVLTATEVAETRAGIFDLRHWLEKGQLSLEGSPTLLAFAAITPFLSATAHVLVTMRMLAGRACCPHDGLGQIKSKFFVFESRFASTKPF